VIGRVGRGHQTGQVFIQTYNPQSPVIQAAVQQVWPTFYQAQLAERQQFGFPPYFHTLKLTAAWANQTSGERAAQQLADKLRHQVYSIKIVGPTPSFYQKLGGKWQWQIIVKAKDRGRLLAVLPQLPSGWTPDLDPINLL
jgi:primosomal protein N' (replication factor Y)